MFCLAHAATNDKRGLASPPRSRFSVFTKLIIFYQCQWLFVLALFKDELA